MNGEISTNECFNTKHELPVGPVLICPGWDMQWLASDLTNTFVPIIKECRSCMQYKIFNHFGAKRKAARIMLPKNVSAWLENYLQNKIKDLRNNMKRYGTAANEQLCCGINADDIREMTWRKPGWWYSENTDNDSRIDHLLQRDEDDLDLPDGTPSEIYYIQALKKILKAIKDPTPNRPCSWDMEQLYVKLSDDRYNELKDPDNCNAQRFVMIEYVLNAIRKWLRESTWDKCFECLHMSTEDAIEELKNNKEE